jgi:hypothetical protein
MEIKVREKYKHWQVKKVSPPKGGGTSSAGRKRFKTPSLQYPKAPARARVMHMEAGTGKIRWVWR